MSRFHARWVTVVSLAVIAISSVMLAILVPQLIASIIALSTPVESYPEYRIVRTAPATPTDSPAMVLARAVVDRLRAEVVPPEGQATEYGVTFSESGYATLRQWNADIELQGGVARAYQTLDLLLPCCDWSMPTNDETRDCRCGHHQAVEGLSKELLSRGWNSRAIEGQVTLWNRYLLPQEAVRIEMEKRAPLDPEIDAALQELKARGEC